MLAVFCILMMLSTVCLAILTRRALTQREDLQNEHQYLTFRIVGYTISVVLGCLGVKFLFLVTFYPLSLVVSESWAIGITWFLLMMYPVQILFMLSGIFLKLKQQGSFQEILLYCRLPMLGIMPLILCWIVVFLLWNL